MVFKKKVPTLPFERALLQKTFDSHTLVKGHGYFSKGAVVELNVNFDEQMITGKVQGREQKPYKVSLFWKSMHPPTKIADADCSCPMVSFCKHTAALIYAAGHKFGFAGEQREEAGQFEHQTETTLPSKLETWLTRIAGSFTQHAYAENRSDFRILYILDVPQSWRNDSQTLCARPVKSRLLKKGGFGAVSGIDFERLCQGDLESADGTDAKIARLLSGCSSAGRWSSSRPLDGDDETTRRALEMMISTGRCFYVDTTHKPLSMGHARPAQVVWTLGQDGCQYAKLDAGEPQFKPFFASTFYYLDSLTNEFGPLNLTISVAQARDLLAAPAIKAEHVRLIRERLSKLSLPANQALPALSMEEEVLRFTPVPCLSIKTKNSMPQMRELMRYGYSGGQLHCMDLSFSYGGRMIDATSTSSDWRILEDNKVKVYVRDFAFEKQVAKELESLKFAQAPNGLLSAAKLSFVAQSSYKSAEIWLSFVDRHVPQLREKGWLITEVASFSLKLAQADDEWSAEISDDGNYWFSLELGVNVDGKRVSLLPVILAALRKSGCSALKNIEDLNSDGRFYAPLADGRYISLPFERMKAVLSALEELFDGDGLGDRVEITPGGFLELIDAGVEFENSDRIKSMAERLQRFIEKNKAVSAVETAAGFASSLRSYQKEGLGWIEFLSECQAGGILADDMGLGKTVQALAHIWKEKAEGRLKKPVLIVCPTSVAPNWLSEAKKHSPKLKVLSLTGPDRESKFPQIRKFDIAISTYALLHRDTEELLPVEWSMVVLDEAQYIKNPATQAAGAAFELKAETRLCLTGTPVENHLGELWSQFNFLAPGLLGTLKSFTNKYRTPIEKMHDKNRQKLLSRRISPFLLRRTKTQVATELPEKTVIIQPVELEGAQRDLYETVRLAMDERIRDEIALKGFKRSQIVILDALLKLRQVCCDPRLVKLDAAKKAGRGAKLSELMDVVPQLVEAGRKILLFSQFTSMLDLIADELNDRKISYVQLRGDTRDRTTPVKRFQNGDVPVFLISLKAGGTGLNLTAADTVIHYDPWWNPAVENQATDRAHRIGQDKPVFVYKIIATGTIEERILEMQKRKQAIADAVFDAEKVGSIAITQEDLAYLLAPIGAQSDAASTKPAKNKLSATVLPPTHKSTEKSTGSAGRSRPVKEQQNDDTIIMSVALAEEKGDIVDSSKYRNDGEIEAIVDALGRSEVRNVEEKGRGAMLQPLNLTAENEVLTDRAKRSIPGAEANNNVGELDAEPTDPFARALFKRGISPEAVALAFTPPGMARSSTNNQKRTVKK